MRKAITAVAALVLAIAFSSVGAQASASGSIGCGGGNGASTPCNGQSLGSVTVSGGLASGSVDVAITSVSGLPSSVASLEVFTPNTDQFSFSFSSVGTTFASDGSFSFTDLTEPSLLTITGIAEYSTTPSDTSISMLLEATGYTFEGVSGSLNNVTGNATLNLTGDPTVTSMTGSVGLPAVSGGGGSTPSGTTPEPGTLLLLGSGLTGLSFIRRRKSART